MPSICQLVLVQYGRQLKLLLNDRYRMNVSGQLVFDRKCFYLWNVYHVDDLHAIHLFHSPILSIHSKR
jgi:hypothetical protein